MSWTTVFPVLTDEMVDEYQAGATATEKARLDEWLGVEAVFNARHDLREVAALALFWKNVDVGEPDLPEPSEEALRSDRYRSERSGLTPWEAYVQPVLDGAAKLRHSHPEVNLVVHLARDMAFLTDRLVVEGCEVRLMRSSSLRLMPGLLWRYLPLQDEPVDVVSILDADGVVGAGWILDRSARLKQGTVPTWRRPNAYADEVDTNGKLVYRPIIGWPFGTRVKLPIRQLMEAFIWHSLRGNLPLEIHYPGRGVVPIFGTEWPGYGFDEWFLMVAVYPRLAAEGMITDIESAKGGFLLGLDLEYATWANAAHETVTPLRMVPPLRIESEMTSALRAGPRLLQFGTCNNSLVGWENYDFPEVDITKPLPFPDHCALAVLLEHVIEHVTPQQAWAFFRECRRVLAPGGILRLAFPDVVKIYRHAPQAYDEFVQRHGWGDGTRESSMRAILFEHGHQGAWSAEVMVALLEAQGYRVTLCSVGQSAHSWMKGLEQHGTQIGEEINYAETTVLEAENLSPLERENRATRKEEWGLPMR
jgi:predicted SAM-dependent methyltransferase